MGHPTVMSSEKRGLGFLVSHVSKTGRHGAPDPGGGTCFEESIGTCISFYAHLGGYLWVGLGIGKVL